jgi:hypothetical protein
MIYDSWNPLKRDLCGSRSPSDATFSGLWLDALRLGWPALASVQRPISGTFIGHAA